MTKEQIERMRNGRGTVCGVKIGDIKKRTRKNARYVDQYEFTFVHPDQKLELERWLRDRAILCHRVEVVAPDSTPAPEPKQRKPRTKKAQPDASAAVAALKQLTQANLFNLSK